MRIQALRTTGGRQQGPNVRQNSGSCLRCQSSCHNTQLWFSSEDERPSFVSLSSELTSAWPTASMIREKKIRKRFNWKRHGWLKKRILVKKDERKRKRKWEEPRSSSKPAGTQEVSNNFERSKQRLKMEVHTRSTRSLEPNS